MIKYNNLLDALFIEWRKTYSEEEQKLFCADGIMKKWSNIDVDDLWEKSSRKIMFLLKDCPDGYGYDTREMLTDEFSNGDLNRKLKNKFTKKIAKVLYGLLKDKAEPRKVNNTYVDEHMDEVEKVWNTEPFVFIETKKLAGKTDLASASLKAALNKDKIFLAKEIDILRPKIIVCFDGGNDIFNFITDDYFLGVAPTVKKQYKYPNANFKCCLYYYEQYNTVVINSHHPSDIEDDWIFQERILSPFHAFLEEHPNF